MRTYIRLFAAGLAVFVSCQEKQTQIQLPDIKSSFSRQLLRKDSTLSVDSFYLVGIDTMTEKSSLVHERFPYFHILGRLAKRIDSLSKLVDQEMPKPSYDELEQIKTMEGEKKYVTEEIDSLNRLLVSADSVKPVGYRAIYKVTVRKKDKFSVSDSIAYSLSLKMQLSDWDRNIEKDIDSLAVGSHVLRGPFNLKSPRN